MFDSSEIEGWLLQLKGQVENTKENVKKGLQEGEFLINKDSQKMIPYDSGNAYETWFSNIKEDGDEIVLTIGYDEQGRFMDYLPLIHEISPIAGDYGRYADPKQQYTQEGFKLITDKPMEHEPQTKFLEKAIMDNWSTIRDDKIKIKFNKD